MKTLWGWVLTILIFTPWVGIYLGVEFLLHLFGIPHPHFR